MAHQSNARGSLRLDKQYKGVGRIAKATGTTDPRQLKLYAGMLDTLYGSGRLDILTSIRDGVVTIAEVWAAYRPAADRPADLNRLPSPETMRRLWLEENGREVGALERWIAAHDVSETHRANLRRDARQLKRYATKDATVRDLPKILAKYRARCVADRKARAFNMARTTLQAFLHHTVGQHNALWVAVSDVRPLPERRQAGQPMTPDEARAYCAWLGPKFGAAMWAMCVTGMGPKEYWGEWTVQADRIHIVGTKRASRVRDVPLVQRIGPPTVAVSSFRDHLYRLRMGRVVHHAPIPDGMVLRSAYDGRRTFAHWMAEAGIPRARRIAYMGHGRTGDVTDLYERHEVVKHLKADGALLRRYLGVPESGAGGLTLVNDGGA